MMKRLSIIFLSIMLMSALMATSVYAAGAGRLAVSPASPQPGEDIVVTFYASGLGQVSALAMEFDVPDGLVCLNAEWLIDGTLEDVDVSTGRAVLAFGSSTDLSAETAIFAVTYQISESVNIGTGKPFTALVTMKLQSKLESVSLSDITLQQEIKVAVDCTHPVDKQEVRNKTEATCSSAGYTGDTYCKRCQQLLQEGSDIPATGDHVASKDWKTDTNNHWYVCVNAGCEQRINVAAHSYQWVTDKAPTEDSTGVKHEECSVCGLKRNENTPVEKLEHQHTGITHHAAVAATCVSEGNVEYWTCSGTECNGKYYGDSGCSFEIASVRIALDSDNHEGETEIRNKTEATCGKAGYTGDVYCKSCRKLISQGSGIPATGNHTASSEWRTDGNNHWHICTNVGCEQKLDVAVHNFQWVTDKTPTEDSTGVKHEECNVCGLKRNENTFIEKLEHQHTGITRHAAVAATCVSEGNVEYWTCSGAVCSGKYYGDVNCSQELTVIATSVDKDNHKNTALQNKKNATCGSDGYTGDTCCTDCGAVVSSGRVIPATGDHSIGSTWYYDATSHWRTCANTGCGQKVELAEHSYTWVVDKPATETSSGLKHEVCECGSERSQATVIPQLQHTHVGITHFGGVPATCVSSGTVEYWTCGHADCAGKYYGDAACQIQLDTIVESVNKNRHTGRTTVKNEKAATCGEDGYTGDVYCGDCNAMITRGKVAVATGMHTPKADYQADKNHHWKVCETCNAVIGNAREPHTYTWVIDKPATETSTGRRHQACTVCGHKTNENSVIDKVPHALEFVAAKPSTCTQDGVIEHFFCAGCDKYFASENGKYGKQISKEATVLPASGHTYLEQWRSDAEGHWRMCVCGEKSETEQHQVEVRGAVETTGSTEGYTGDSVCRTCGYVVSVGEVIPVSTDETEPPYEEQVQVPDATEPVDSGEKNRAGVHPIIIAAALAVAGCAAYAVIQKKRGK